MDPVKIVFASSNYGPLWRAPADSWLRVIAKTQKHLVQNGLGEIAATGITDRQYTHSADNILTKEFLSDPSWTHLFHTESDMVLPDDTIIKLLEVDQPIVSGVYFLRNGNGQPCLYVKTYCTKDNPYVHSPVSIFPTDRPFALDPKGHGGCPGLGCVLIRREVFEAIPFPWFDLKESFYGSDMYFFTKVRDAGFDVWIQPSVHPDQIDYTVVGLADYHHRVNHDKDFAASGYIVGTNGWSGAHRRLQLEPGRGEKQ